MCASVWPSKHTEHWLSSAAARSVARSVARSAARRLYRVSITRVPVHLCAAPTAPPRRRIPDWSTEQVDAFVAVALRSVSEAAAGFTLLALGVCSHKMFDHAVRDASGAPEAVRGSGIVL